VMSWLFDLQYITCYDGNNNKVGRRKEINVQAKIKI